MQQPVIYSADGHRRLIIVRRDDGLFHIFEETLQHDDEVDVSYWSRPMLPLPGLYDSAETAEREARTWPHCRDAASD